MLQPFVLPESVTSFDDYFRLSVGTETILKALGYNYASQHVALPRTFEALPAATLLYKQIDDVLPLVELISETACRETLIAPILLEAARHVRAKLRIEFPVDAGARLRGCLDYLLVSDSGLLIVEANQDDMSRGFTQLAAKMIAVDKIALTSPRFLYGTVSDGEVWRFGVLDRMTKTVVQDAAVFTTQDRMEDLLAVLIGILQGTTTQTL